MLDKFQISEIFLIMVSEEVKGVIGSIPNAV